MQRRVVASPRRSGTIVSVLTSGLTPETTETVETARQGRLVLAATPIGNVADASARLVDLLATADVVAAEDTRRLRRLASALGVEPVGRIVSCYEHNEQQRVPELLEVVRAGGTVVLVTDAGMPSVSDPGYRLVRGCIEAGLRVTAAPGPSAVLTALALSGLPSDRFAFEGFPPRRPGERARSFAALAADRRTLVFFESPHRTAATLAALATALGADRPAAVCRELTKTYEEIVRGSLGELQTWAEDQEVRGEVALVVAGAPDAPVADPADLVEEVLRRVEGGERMKVAAAEVARAHGVSSRSLYEEVLRARGGTA